MAKISFSEKLKNILGGKKNFSEDFFEDLTDALIEGDLGAKNAVEIVDNLESFCKKEKKFSPEEITVELKNILMKFLKQNLGVAYSKKTGMILKSINGYYFNTRYPGNESFRVDSEDIELCIEAIKSCRKETFEIINSLENKLK